MSSILAEIKNYMDKFEFESIIIDVPSPQPQQPSEVFKDIFHNCYDLDLFFSDGTLKFSKLIMVILFSYHLDVLVASDNCDGMIFSESCIDDFLCEMKQITKKMELELQTISSDNDFNNGSSSLSTFSPLCVDEDSRSYEEPKIWQCESCLTTFKQKKDLANHLKYVHSTLKPFKCGYCHLEYKRKQDLNFHIAKKHSTKFSTTTSCQHCGKRFGRK